MSKKIYIALLRGINVGGHTVKMDKLRQFFSELGLEDVRTFIQTGNVFFKSDQKEDSLRKKIEEQLESKLGYKVAVCLRTIDQLEQVLKKDPFSKVKLDDQKRFAINFLATPVDQIKTPFLTPDGGYEVIKATPTELYVVWHLKNGRPANSYGSLEKMVQTDSTTRFWHTSLKILDASKKLQI